MKHLLCLIGLHRWAPRHQHGRCVFSTEIHYVRRCLRCPKQQDRFGPASGSDKEE